MTDNGNVDKTKEEVYKRIADAIVLDKVCFYFKILVFLLNFCLF